jgi:hypothetical protein
MGRDDRGDGLENADPGRLIDAAGVAVLAVQAVAQMPTEPPNKESLVSVVKRSTYQWGDDDGDSGTGWGDENAPGWEAV